MEQNNACNDEIDLFELSQKLYKQRWIIFGITALTTTLAILVSIFMPKAYKAEAMVEVPIIGSKIIDISEIQEGIKVYKDNTLKDVLKNIKVSPVKNSQNMAKIEVEGASPQIAKIEVEGASPQIAKENLEKAIETINKKIFPQKVEELKEKYTIRLNYINQIISDVNSKNNIIYDPSRMVDLLTEKEQIQKWLQDPKFIILATEIQASSKPVRPKPLLYTLIGFMIGLFLGIFVALVLEAIKSKRISANHLKS